MIDQNERNNHTILSDDSVCVCSFFLISRMVEANASVYAPVFSIDLLHCVVLFDFFFFGPVLSDFAVVVVVVVVVLLSLFSCLDLLCE